MLGLLAVFGLVLANGFFVSAEFALVGSRRTRLEEMSRAGDRKATLAARAIQSLDRYIAATQLGITLASLGLGWIGKPAVAVLLEGAFAWLPAAVEPFATEAVAVVMAFAFITMLHIVLGELTPKAVALLYPESVSSLVAAPLMGFAWVMHWPIQVLNGLANASLRLFRIEAPSTSERVHSPEEIRMLVAQSRESGRLLPEDARLLTGVFEFSEKSAEEVMTPRTEVVALPADATVMAAADVAADAKKSRYPVYHETLDEIVGIVHTKDLLQAVSRQPGAQVKDILRPPLFVPGTREVEDVLVDMKRLKTHMAVVLDEYGGTAGVVTMEDLLEEIVGPLEDEFDVATATRRKPEEGGEAAVLDGAMPISDFNEEFGESLSDADYTTMGGWVFGQLGRLPRVGDQVTAGKRVLEVAEMEGRRVKAIRVVS